MTWVPTDEITCPNCGQTRGNKPNSHPLCSYCGRFLPPPKEDKDEPVDT